MNIRTTAVNVPLPVAMFIAEVVYPNMYGLYFYGDYCSGNMKVLYQSGASGFLPRLLINALSGSVVTFGQDHHNELYTSNYNSGIIYHLIDASQAPGKNVPPTKAQIN